MPRLLPISGYGHTSGDLCAGFALRQLQQRVRRNGADFDLNVDAVEQGAGDTPLIPRHLVGRTAAGPGGMPQIAAGTGIHRRDELKPRRKLGLPRRAGNMNTPGLQWFAQALQHGAVKFGEFVEEKNILRGQTDFAGPDGSRAAAHQRHRRRGVVRAAHKTAPPLRRIEASHQTEHRRALQRLRAGQGRQQAGKTLRQHGLAAARRPHHQHMMSPGCGDFQRAFRRAVAAHFGHVGRVGRCNLNLGRCDRLRGAVLFEQVGHHLLQITRTKNSRGLRQSRLFSTGLRQNQPRLSRLVVPLRPKRTCHGQRSPRRAQRPGERQLSCESMPLQTLRRDEPLRCQQPDGNGQIEAAGLLGQIGRCQVDDDALVRRKTQPAIDERAAHAVACLAHLGLGQPDDGEAGQAGRKMHLHRDRRRLHAQQRPAGDLRQRHGRGSAPGVFGRRGRALRPVVQPGLQFAHLSFEGIDLLARGQQHALGGVELVARHQVEPPRGGMRQCAQIALRIVQRRLFDQAADLVEKRGIALAKAVVHGKTPEMTPGAHCDRFPPPGMRQAIAFLRLAKD